MIKLAELDGHKPMFTLETYGPCQRIGCPAQASDRQRGQGADYCSPTCRSFAITTQNVTNAIAAAEKRFSAIGNRAGSDVAQYKAALHHEAAMLYQAEQAWTNFTQAYIEAKHAREQLDDAIGRR